MLFYTQIKKEFRQLTWQRGQIYFRGERVKDVRLDGDLVTGKVQGSDSHSYDTAIVMARGTIYNSKCTCPIHKVKETHCKHVAALAIWIVERGSLLRAGVSAGENGVAKTASLGSANGMIVLARPQKAANDHRLRKLLILHPFLATSKFVLRRDLMAGLLEGTQPNGESFSIPVTRQEALALLEYAGQEKTADSGRIEAAPILFVKGVFTLKQLAAISVESALRYRDPKNHTLQIVTLQYLTKLPEPGLWKTSLGLVLQTPPPADVSDPDASFIQQMATQKIFYHGPEALENLARLLTHRNRDQMVFDPAIEVPIVKDPLKLTTLTIGAKTEKTRSLGFEFRLGELIVTSEQLDALAQQNRLSQHYVWIEDRIYRFETSLTRLRQFTNRTGVAADEGSGAEGEDGQLTRVQGSASLHDDGEHPLHPIAAYRLSLEMGAENFQVDPEWKEFHEWYAVFNQKKLPALPKLSYGFSLRGYQENGLRWMWSLYHRGLSALLADDMGLGKTHQVLAYLSSLYRVKKNKPKQPSLVVAPTSVIAAWVQKLQKYETGLKWHVFHGKGRAMPKSGIDIVLTTYGILQREPDLREREWHAVILDEAQAIKNAQTISARAARALKARFRIAMTGTPVENQATDLWSLMEFLLPGYLGSLPRFKRLYGWGRDVPPDVQAAALKRLISPFILRRTKAQVLTELPEKTEEIVHCELTAAQRKIYRATLNGADAERAREALRKGGKIDYANILALLTRLKQVCDHPQLPRITAAGRPEEAEPKAQAPGARPALAAVPVGLATDNGQVPAAAAAQGPVPGRSLRVIRRPAAPVPPGPAVAAAPAAPKPKVVPGKRGLERAKVIASVDPAESGKWEAFDELLEEALGSGLKVVVFTQYLGMIDLISHALKQKGVGHTELRGDTPDRGARLEKFANDPECKVFLCSLLAGGLGIDLTAASVCIHMDRWWNPAKENQATDRLHRYGQTRGVQVFKLQIPGTVEDRIASIIQSKMQLADALIEESSLGLKSFSRKELLELLSPAAEDDEPAHADEA